MIQSSNVIKKMSRRCKNCLNLPCLPHMRHSGVIYFVAALFLLSKSLFLNTHGNLSQSFSNNLEFYTKCSCDGLKVVLHNKIQQTPVSF